MCWKQEGAMNRFKNTVNHFQGQEKILKDEAGVNISRMNWWAQVEIIALSLEMIIPFQLLIHDMTARGRARYTVRTA